MFGKLNKARNIFREEGLSKFVCILRERTARRLGGNTLSNFFQVMGYYTHPDGERIPLYAGYREYLKPRHFLAHTDEAGFELFFRDNSDSYIREGSVRAALHFCSFITNELQIEIKGKKILEVGCDDGALTYVLAAHGAKQIDGVDLEFSGLRFHGRRHDFLRDVVKRLPIIADKKIEELEKNIKMYELDIQSPEITDRFDVIISKNVLEHIGDLRKSLCIMHDLLEDGGIMVHKFNPFFSENGGHEFCILDFPWGHVRLSQEEIQSYLRTYRAWEKEKALDVLDHNFNNPKLTLSEIDNYAVKLGFRTVYASEKRSYSWRPDSSPARILRQCRRNYPKIVWRDLVSDEVIRVYRKEA